MLKLTGDKMFLAETLADKFIELCQERQGYIVNFILKRDLAIALYEEIEAFFFDSVFESIDELQDILLDEAGAELLSVENVGNRICIQPIISSKGTTLIDEADYFLIDSEVMDSLDLYAFSEAETIDVLMVREIETEEFEDCKLTDEEIDEVTDKIYDQLLSTFMALDECGYKMINIETEEFVDMCGSKIPTILAEDIEAILRKNLR